MSGYGVWALTERERVLVPQAEREAEAYAAVLDLAFEYAFRGMENEGVQGLINELSRNRSLYGIIVYDLDGRVRYISDPLVTVGAAPREQLGSVLQGREVVAFERQLNGQRVYSVLRTLRGGSGDVIGAIEVAQPLSFIEAHKAAVRARYFLNTLTLLVTLAIVTLWLVRHVVGRRLAAFIGAVRAVGREERATPMPEEQWAEELTALAREFNAMTARLAVAREALIDEGEARIELERDLRRSDRLATAGVLAAGLAHEVAAPLNVILGRAELLLKHEPSDSPRARHLRIIVDEIGRITTIVRGLLDHARRREPRRDAVEMGAVLDRGVKLLETELTRAQVALIRHADAPAWVRGDSDQLHQVFVNLMLNAIQAMDRSEGTTRELRLCITRTAARDGVTAAPAIVLDLEDTGPGIPATVSDALFTPFVTTKADGTGLGLVIARSIVSEHGGTLDVVAGRDGRGATFRITLPALVDEGRHG